MHKPFDFRGKRVLVIGMARSGIQAALLLIRHGAFPILNDIKSRDAFGSALDVLEGQSVEWRLGESPLPLLENADALVISPGVPIDNPAVLAAQERGLYVIGELELAAQFAAGTLIGVTGTNGKTTTVTLLDTMFREAGRTSWLSGNIGTPFSLTALSSKPEDILVTEVSSFQLESIDIFHPRAAAVLNVTEDHLIRHYTMECYIAMKRRIFENQKASDLAVLNYDDPICVGMADGLKARVAWFSRKTEVCQGAFVRDGKLTVRLGKREWTLCDTEEIGIPGPHNLENAMAAAVIALDLNASPEAVVHALKTFRGVEHRIEFVRELDGVRYINDSKGTNPDSTVKAVDTMRKPTVLILGGYDKHVSFLTMAKHIAESPQIAELIIIGATKDQLRRELAEAGTVTPHEAGSFEEALDMARKLAQPGWNVLMSPACASFDMFTCFEERGERFKAIVNGWPSGDAQA
ncbi:MAG: UDP-N-acetylmuramoyl-L-alanine--D-glutamate ligase [Clostridia bacterium]|nr:UDP-N-acetylmuramoyl-L-alanine--D-glutamate ligase [Clostridia bacterium]